MTLVNGDNIESISRMNSRSIKPDPQADEADEADEADAGIIAPRDPRDLVEFNPRNRGFQEFSGITHDKRGVIEIGTRNSAV